MVSSMDPRHLKENNRRLAQETNRLRLDLRVMHDHHEKERQDLQDEIVCLRQVAGEIGAGDLWRSLRSPFLIALLDASSHLYEWARPSVS